MVLLLYGAQVVSQLRPRRSRRTPNHPLAPLYRALRFGACMASSVALFTQLLRRAQVLYLVNLADHGAEKDAALEGGDSRSAGTIEGQRAGQDPNGRGH